MGMKNLCEIMLKTKFIISFRSKKILIIIKNQKNNIILGMIFHMFSIIEKKKTILRSLVGSLCMSSR